jgi:DUF1680 family protein
MPARLIYSLKRATHNFGKRSTRSGTTSSKKQLYITGGCGPLYDGASPDGAADQQQITRVHQAYGRNYQLPNVTAHNETCASVGLVLWNWRMFLATGEARFMDVVELALYNGVQAGVSLDSENYFYSNPLRNVDPLPTELRFPRTRQPFFTSFCCPPNAVRTIAETGGYAYSKKGQTLWVNLYGGNMLETTLNGGRLSITQKTDYPWSGNVDFTVDQWGRGEFELKLRIPGWHHSATLKLNGKPADAAPAPGSYASLKRQWQTGDRIELDLAMPIELMESHPLVEETRNQVAVKRGPVVYCLETAGLPYGVKMSGVYLTADVTNSVPRFDNKVLDGVTLIECEGAVVEETPWQGRLYRPLPGSKPRPANFTLTPHYAWANRGSGVFTRPSIVSHPFEMVSFLTGRFRSVGEEITADVGCSALAASLSFAAAIRCLINSINGVAGVFDSALKRAASAIVGLSSQSDRARGVRRA